MHHPWSAPLLLFFPRNAEARPPLLLYNFLSSIPCCRWWCPSQTAWLAGGAEGTAREENGTAEVGPQGPLAIAPEAFADALEQKALGAEKLMDCVVKVLAPPCILP